MVMRVVINSTISNKLMEMCSHRKCEEYTSWNEGYLSPQSYSE